MVFRVTVGYKTFMFTDKDKAVDFAVMAKQTVIKGKYDKAATSVEKMCIMLEEHQRVLLKDATFSNSAAWNVHPLQCEDVTLDNVIIRNPCCDFQQGTFRI